MRSWAIARLAAAAAAALVAAVAHGAPAAPAPEKNVCAKPAAPLALGSAQWNGWGKDVENTRYQPEPALRAPDVPKLALKWAFGYQGSAVAGQPTVVDGRLFVSSAAGRVYSLDARSGCTYWTFDLPVGTRTAIAIGEFGSPRNAQPAAATPQKKHRGSSSKAKHPLMLAHLDVFKAPTAAFFGDDSGAVYAVDAQRGTLLWKAQLESHPRAHIYGAPIVYHGRLYVAVASSEQSVAADAGYACCTFRGSVVALDMASGRIIWRTYTVATEPKALPRTGSSPAFGPAGAAVVGSPTIDVKRNVLYVATSGSLTPHSEPLADAVVALDLNDGQVRWSKQFSRHEIPGAADFSSAMILRTLADGRQLLLAAQRSGMVYALDPEHPGDVIWQTKGAEGAIPAGVEWGPAADHRNVYVALSGLAAEPDNGSGAITALDMRTGSRRWYTVAPSPACTWGVQACSHGQAQAVTVIPGIAFSGAMDGHLRAYSTIDGKIVWDYETAKDFPTINGVSASGGSLDQGGATIVNGVLYINSGYGQRSGQPGNVLLAFSIDGK